MKTLKQTVLLALFFCFIFNLSYAQKRYQIHQDNVKPSMVGEYEKTAKTFVEACKKHNPQSPWITATTSDMKYLYISPMENFADLDKNLFADMAKAMGDEWGNMFENFDKCYDTHNDYVITLSESLTYMPEGITQTQEGMNHRKWYYMYYTPENGKKVYDAMKDVKDLFASKGSKNYYRVYKSGFGCDENFYLVAISSKDEMDDIMRGKANETVLGEERGPVFGNLMSSISRFEELSGDMRPDLSYSPK
ncbi:hypothetical protein [Yeosuana sp.]|uniref:hypothetical protein n=1 Tax=Yeosuana sp. TaxID=2529388 RepID=UPI004054DD85